MPDDRMIHRRMLRGDRIAALTDFERGVWLAYQLLADDFGVMRFSAIDLQKAVWLERKPQKTIQRGFQAVVDTGLISTFQDGGRWQVYQRDWNSWQKVRHPRTTIEPCPPAEELRKCDSATQALFRQHSRCPPEFLREDSGKVSEIVPQDSGFTRAPALAMAKANGNGSDSSEPFDSFEPELPPDSIDRRAGDFVERYKALHIRLRFGAHYVGKPGPDFEEAKLLAAVYDDDRLDKLAFVWLNTDLDFAQNGTRTIAKFRSQASWCEEQLIAWERKHGPLTVAVAS